jgi:hypothetical protein
MKIGRRGFLGFMGGAVVAGPKLAQTAADPILKQAGFSSGGAVGHAAPMAVPVMSEGATAKIIKWIRRNGIPAWKMTEIRNRADYKRAGIDPDLACLVSVSPGWKAREQRRRNLEREIEMSLSSIGRSGGRRAFEERVQQRFGEYLDWYD